MSPEGAAWLLATGRVVRMRSAATGATVKVLPEFVDAYLEAGWNVIGPETKGREVNPRDELAKLLTETSRAYIGEYGAYVDEVEAPHLADAILAAGYSKRSEELARYKRGAKTLGEIIEKQCRDVLDVTGLHHLINEDGDGHWDVVWMRLFEMRDELASLKESTIARERQRGDSWRDRAQEMDSRAQTLEVELRAATERADAAEAAVQRVGYLLDATDPARYAILSMEGLRVGIRSALEGGGAA